MKGLIAAVAAAAFVALGCGIGHVAADSYSVTSGTSVDGSGTGVCASTSLQVQQNGNDVVNQSESKCAP